MAAVVRRIAVSLSATAALLLLAGGQVQVRAASSTPVLVELFTSEGCSSCPPADRLLRELDARQDIPGAHVIVLSEHVDYWNQLGWRDAFSSPEWTSRQEHYAELLRNGEVYTPEAVVDGARGVVGSDGAALRAAITASARTEKQPLTIAEAEWQGDRVSATLSGGPFHGATLYAALADERDRSQVAAGENAGHALDHVAVARSLSVVADGQNRLHLSVPRGTNGHLRLIVFAQAKDGHILTVAERTLQREQTAPILSSLAIDRGSGKFGLQV